MGHPPLLKIFSAPGLLMSPAGSSHQRLLCVCEPTNSNSRAALTLKTELYYGSSRGGVCEPPLRIIASPAHEPCRQPKPSFPLSGEAEGWLHEQAGCTQKAARTARATNLSSTSL